MLDAQANQKHILNLLNAKTKRFFILGEIKT